MTVETNPQNLVFDREYEETLELDDGTAVRLRLLRPEDREKLKRGFEQLSSESRYRRFLSSKPRLSERELEYLTDVDQYDHVALGAELAAGDREREGIGVARCVRLEEKPTVAEAAVTVVDEFQHRGLGRNLLDRLVAAALERGIETFRASLFRENESMRSLLEEIGSELEVVDRDGPVVTVDVRLAGERIHLPEPLRPSGVEIPRENPLRSILSLAAEGVVSLVEKFPPWQDEQPARPSSEESKTRSQE